MVVVKPNAQSFEIEGLKYGNEIKVAVDGDIVQTFTVQMDDAKLSLYLNKQRRAF